MLLMLSLSELSEDEEVVMTWFELVVLLMLELVVVVEVTLSICTAEGWRDMIASPS